MKKKFYIFLDIDGVLWDEPHILEQSKNDSLYDSLGKNAFKKESMQALNLLIEGLEQSYSVQLVISSDRRGDMQKTTKVLYDNELKYQNKIDKTPATLSQIRGFEIKKYLLQKNELKSYVVIDDEIADIKPFVPMEKIIKTSDQSALNLKQVKHFLNKHNLLTEELEF